MGQEISANTQTVSLIMDSCCISQETTPLGDGETCKKDRTEEEKRDFV